MAAASTEHPNGPSGSAPGNQGAAEEPGARRSTYVLPEFAARTVTFLLTDIEKSTRLWQKAPDAMASAIQRHDELMTSAIRESGGTVLTERGEGDSFFAVFPGVSSAFAAAVLAQKRIQGERWPAGVALKVRIAIHTGEVRPDYRGPDVNRCARMRSLAYGDQILVTEVAASLGRQHLRGGLSLQDLGRYRLRDLRKPEQVFQLNHPELRSNFPKLKGGLPTESGPPGPASVAQLPGGAPAAKGRLAFPQRLRLYLAIVLIILVVLAVAAILLRPGTPAPEPFGSVMVIAQGVTARATPNIAVDQEGTLYFAQVSENRVASIPLGGSIKIFAGTGFSGDGGDGGPAAQAQLLAPQAVALDGQGRLYVSEGFYIRRIALDGTITTVAGDPAGQVGENIPALHAYIKPLTLAVTKNGDIWFGQAPASRSVMFVDASTGILTRFAGTGGEGYSGDNGPAIYAQFGFIQGIALGPSGDLYLADARYNVIRVVSQGLDHTVSTVAGTGVPGYSGDGGPARRAQLSSPGAVASDKAGNLFIADSENHVIRRVSRAGIITTVAGTGRTDASIDGTPRGTSVGNPSAMTFDSGGRLYVLDPLNQRILRLEPR